MHSQPQTKILEEQKEKKNIQKNQILNCNQFQSIEVFQQQNVSQNQNGKSCYEFINIKDQNFVRQVFETNISEKKSQLYKSQNRRFWTKIQKTNYCLCLYNLQQIIEQSSFDDKNVMIFIRWYISQANNRIIRLKDVKHFHSEQLVIHKNLSSIIQNLLNKLNLKIEIFQLLNAKFCQNIAKLSQRLSFRKTKKIIRNQLNLQFLNQNEINSTKFQLTKFKYSITSQIKNILTQIQLSFRKLRFRYQNKKFDNWTRETYVKYISFIEINREKLESNQTISQYYVLKEFTNYISYESYRKLKNYHANLVYYYGNIENVLKNLKKRFSITSQEIQVQKNKLFQFKQSKDLKQLQDLKLKIINFFKFQQFKENFQTEPKLQFKIPRFIIQLRKNQVSDAKKSKQKIRVSKKIRLNFTIQSSQYINKNQNHYIMKFMSKEKQQHEQYKKNTRQINQTSDRQTFFFGLQQFIEAIQQQVKKRSRSIQRKSQSNDSQLKIIQQNLEKNVRKKRKIWTQSENFKFIVFFLKQQHRFEYANLDVGLFNQMSRFIGTKNRNQCQTHFSTLFSNDAISIDNLKTKFIIDEKTLNEFLNFS